MKKIVLLTLVIFLNFAYAKKSEEKIDYLNLAALMIQDKNYNRAAQMLKQVDIAPPKKLENGEMEEKEPVDMVRFYTLSGLVANRLGKYALAIEHFKNAIKAGQTDKSVYLMLAQNYYKLKKYVECAQAINDAGELAKQKPELFSMKAECYYKSEKLNESFETLAEGIKKFKDYSRFYQQRFYYLMNQKLYQAAVEDADRFFKSVKKMDAKTYVTFASALRKSGEIERATHMMEKANLEFPKDVKVTVLLAHLYIDKEMIQAAAELFDEASIEDKKYESESAEMYRRAKNFTEALFKNSILTDENTKLNQRIAIYLEFGQYERVVAMADSLKRNRVVENEDIRYALAYAYYMVGEYDKSEAELKRLTRSDLFRQATELRKNMEKCKNSPWECE